MFWERNFIHEIVIRSQSGRDSNGDPVAGVITSGIRCRVEARRDMVRGPDGTEVVSAHRIFTAQPITLGTGIWIPHLGDVVGNESQLRFPLTAAQSERLRGGGATQRLTTVYL